MTPQGAVAGASDLAIAGYDDLTADQISPTLKRLSQIELAKVESYERRHHDRTTVLGHIETLKSDEPSPG